MKLACECNKMWDNRAVGGAPPLANRAHSPPTICLPFFFSPYFHHSLSLGLGNARCSSQALQPPTWTRHVDTVQVSTHVAQVCYLLSLFKKFSLHARACNYDTSTDARRHATTGVCSGKDDGSGGGGGCTSVASVL